MWKAGGDGRYQKVINLPNNILDSTYHKGKISGSSNWTVVRWLKPMVLISNSPWSELLFWDLSNLNKGDPIPKLLHTKHRKGLFSIACTLENLDINLENVDEKKSLKTDSK